jgi:C_GCAxxG_C_C family probable redox protein
VLAGFSKSFGLDEETALRVACGFGGGIGRLGLTCGAVTGAIMVIGLKYGKVKADDDAAKEKTYALVQEFAQRFRARNKSLNCTELLGCDLGTAEGREKVKEKNLAATVCEKAVRDAAEILEEML